MTIRDAIASVLINKTLSATEIYNEITSQKLYHFKSMTPISIVQATLRKHTEGINLKKSSNEKLFKLMDGSKYSLIK